MEPAELKPGDIVQLVRQGLANPAFSECLMIVTKSAHWGAQGYVVGLGGSRAHYRAEWDEMERTGGLALWVDK